jgi:hypothetical protein
MMPTMEEEQHNPDYQKGYNDGYLIARHEPDLADKLKDVSDNTPRMEGFQAGRKQLLRDRFKERLPEWVQDDPDKDQDKSIEPEKDKDQGIEPEF